jgi:hypothetical protein
MSMVPLPGLKEMVEGISEKPCSKDTNATAAPKN